MSPATRAVVTAVVAALVAVAAFAGAFPLVAVAALLALLVAVGWPALMSAPAPVGTGVTIGLAGVAGVTAVALTDGEPFLRGLPEVLALAVLVVFVHELVRRDGRERLVESVAGTVSGAVASATAAGWVAAERTASGVPLVVTAAVALAVGSAVAAVPVTGWLGLVLTVVTAVAAGAGAGQVLPDVGALPGAVLGLAGGILAATVHRMLDRLPAMRRRWAALAGAVLPVTVSGVVVYVVGRVLVG